MLGTDPLHDYLARYGIELDPQLEALLGSHAKKAWTKFANADNQHLVRRSARRQLLAVQLRPFAGASHHTT